jgi:N-acetylmuramoyl-L-alanine amidase
MEFTAAQLAAMTDREASSVLYVVVHHTADPDESKDIAEIAREEEASQGFVTVGYHAVIHSDGTVQYGRPIDKVPAANLGLNTVSYAVALEGNFQPGSPGYCGEKPTAAQLTSLVAFIEEAKRKLPRLTYLIGHRDVARIVNTPSDATACPGDDLYGRLHELRALTHLAEA